MADPDCVIELAAITIINVGTDVGWAEEDPVPVVHVPLQTAGFGLVESANPLKLAGAEPPDSEFALVH
jgi:hypothetical protein